jgi:hypothetical protein
MSYDIIYNRAFIKVDENRTIPFLLMGSSNLFESSGSNTKRVRSWCNMRFNDIIETNDNILKGVDDHKERIIERHPNEVDAINKNFSWYSGVRFYGNIGTSFTKYKNYFINGIKRAKTIEEYKSLNIQFYVHVYSWNKVEDFHNKNIEYKEDVYITDTNHLIETVKEFSDYYFPLGYSVYIQGIGLREKDNRLIKPKVKKSKTVLTLDEVYSIKCTNNNAFLIRLLKYGYKFSYMRSDKVKQFQNEKKANAYLKRLKDNERFYVSKDIGTFLLAV